MINVLYIPLDERPVNYSYPQAIAFKNVHMITPPFDKLGQKKTSADVDGLWKWVNANVEGCSYFAASIDMLIYGGIVPSRLHSMTREECDERIGRIIALKSSNPDLKLYCFNLIMRLPAYSSDDEEPDYYGVYGRQIFEYAWTLDKVKRNRADEAEKAVLPELRHKIPTEVLEDYVGRREFNSYVNRKMIELVKDGIVDYLVIPLDDSSEYGFSAWEQMELLRQIERGNLQDKVFIYPGADDLGCSLMGRIINEVKGQRPRIFVRYSSVLGPGVIPKYEDRPLGESVKSQILAVGGLIVDSAAEADFVLMVNASPIGGAQMCEAPDQGEKDRAYYAFRNLREFVDSLEYYLSLGKRCALADVAFCNGSDAELMEMLRKRGHLTKLLSYAGWNTAANTLGTVLAHSVSRLNMETVMPDKFLLDRFLEDWGYQALVRQKLNDMGEELGIKYSDLGENAKKVQEVALALLGKFIRDKLCVGTYRLEKVFFPWNRLFEAGFVSRM